MMRKFDFLLSAFTVLVTVSAVNAQVSTPFNFGVAANYVGWNAAQAFPLTVAHKGNQPINFQTNGTQRMTIMNTTGFVGIGTNFTAPANLLHVAAGTNAGYAQITNNTTGNAATDGFRLGVASSGRAEVRQAEALPMDFFTDNAHRMTINGTTGYIGISPVGHFATAAIVPQSMIHMYEPSSGAGPTMGWRDWMRTGVFMDEQTDAMHVV